MPWTVLAECAHVPTPPRDRDRWMINFSRVEWRREVVDGKYVKSKDPATGKDLPEDNWVWSPQGLIAMHYPEMWGVVTFVEAPTDAPDLTDKDLVAHQALWNLYYAQKAYQEKHGHYAVALEELTPVGGSIPAGVRLETCGEGYQATFQVPAGTGVVCIRDDGRIWRSDTP